MYNSLPVRATTILLGTGKSTHFWLISLLQCSPISLFHPFYLHKRLNFCTYLNSSYALSRYVFLDVYSLSRSSLKTIPSKYIFSKRYFDMCEPRTALEHLGGALNGIDLPGFLVPSGIEFSTFCIETSARPLNHSPSHSVHPSHWLNEVVLRLSVLQPVEAGQRERGKV